MLFALLVLPLLASSANCAWHLVWSDEFNGNKLNDANWAYETGGNGWGNNELEFYTAHRHENVRVEHGHLVIDARVENHQGKHFTSGRIHTKHAWTYGRFEASISCPSGHNLWPAFWMMPQGSKYGAWAASGEIDIMELRGDKPHEIMGTIHYGGTAPNNIYHGSGEKRYPQDFSTGFHHFAVEWAPHEIKWFVDGHHYHTENINRNMWSGKGHNPYHKNGEPFDQPFHIIFNLAVGGNFFGHGPYVTPEQAKHWRKHTMEVDYVRVFHWK
ncbi:hypothetical protein TYRP_015795 [Tyrophagus putrescentiae]|nr:hypothetical protein TYRP_015795 [Tyrophagus putrescentiae]